MNLSLTTVAAYWGELEKLAAPRHIKMLRALLKKGKTTEARAFAQRLQAKGVLKQTGVGSQLRHLGKGSEGVATLTVGAKAAPGKLSVRKAFDPKLMPKGEALRSKWRAMRELKGDPRIAKVYSKRLRSKGGTPYYHAEYVTGKTPAALSPEMKRLGTKKLTDAGQTATTGRGLHVYDVRRANVIQRPTGEQVAVDVLASPVEKAQAARALRTRQASAQKTMAEMGLKPSAIQQVRQQTAVYRTGGMSHLSPSLALQRLNPATGGVSASLPQTLSGFSKRPTYVAPRGRSSSAWEKMKARKQRAALMQQPAVSKPAALPRPAAVSGRAAPTVRLSEATIRMPRTPASIAGVAR